MILRRLANAFRRQDWFTLAVEALVVVLGVFIGLQVDNWNTARQERAIAHQLEVSLIADANVVLDETRQKIVAMAEAAEAMDALLDMFSRTDEELLEANVQTKIEFALYLPNHAKRSPGLVEAQSDGDFSLIGDVDLRHAILQWDRLLQDSAQAQQARREFTRAYVSPLVRLDALIGVVPFEAALSDSGSRNDMIIALDAMTNILRAELSAFANVEAETEDLLTQLQEKRP